MNDTIKDAYAGYLFPYNEGKPNSKDRLSYSATSFGSGECGVSCFTLVKNA